MADPEIAAFAKQWRWIKSHSGPIVLIVVLGLLPVRAWSQGGDDEITVERPADGFNSITWTGSVAADGRIAVRVHYDLDEAPRTFDIRLPPGASFFAVDGVPTSADYGRFATAEIAGPVTITYEIAGRVRRYRDGALVVLAGTNGDEDPAVEVEPAQNEIRLASDYGLFACPHCFITPSEYGATPVFGAIYAAGAADGEVLVAGVDPVRRDTPVGAEPDVITFFGSNEFTGDVALLAVLPAEAVPDVERSEGDVTSALEAFRARFANDDDRFRTAELVDAPVDRTAAWILTALFGLLVVVLVASPRRATRSDRGRRQSTERQSEGEEIPRLSKSSLPSDLSPAMAALVVDPLLDHDRSFVAATILDLGRRRVITISGNDNRRFTITIPARLDGVSAFERAVLTQMRPLGVQPDPPKATEIVAPPVWHGRSPIVIRALDRAVIREGVRAKLIRRDRRPLAILPISISMGLVALIVADGLTVHAWLAMIVGAAIGIVATVEAATKLTASGREQRDIWNDYATWLNGDKELQHASVPDVEILGELLVYGVALGAAPWVARALSPLPDGRP